jgi:Flp pilus assembly protein TadG
MSRWIGRIGGNEGGAVAPTVALSLFALIGAGGIAFDYARMASLDSELHNAADQAALAAASQLDGELGACSRAVSAARTLLTNQTLQANDGRGLDIDIDPSAVCTSDTAIVDDPNASIRFFQDKRGTTPATNNKEANFVQVRVVVRKVDFALTPIVGALSSGELDAQARAGMGTALCKVPPLMICPPTGTVDWAALRGHGIRAVSQSGPNWAPGAFGYIGPQDANSTQIGLAFQNPVFQCQEIEGEEPVSTGAPTPAIVAINTRFDIYDMSGGGGQALTPCLGAACPPALNVTKDLVNIATVDPSANNACKIHNSGWRLPAANRRFRPEPKAGTDPMRTFQKAGQPIDAMGLPRDNCHYDSFNTAAGGYVCPGANPRFGDGAWARGDYFNKYHSGDPLPDDVGTITRYETYLWEIANSHIPNDSSGTLRQHGTAVCNATIPDPSRDRRVLQVAVGSNCGALHGASTPVQVGAWVDMFLVEPGVPPGGSGRGNGDGGNEIYMEVIGPVTPGGNAAQIIRRDVPYLVK